MLTYSRLTPIVPRFQLGNVTPADPGDAAGPEGERYPHNIDNFIPIPTPPAGVTEIGHYHIAQDYRLLYAVIIAIQTAIGLSAAGNAGTIAARLYGQGNMKQSIASVGYNRFQRGWVSVIHDSMKNPPAGPPQITLPGVDFDGEITGYGEDQAIVFARVGRVAGGASWLTTESWRLALLDNFGRSGGQNQFTYTSYDLDGVQPNHGGILFIQYAAVNWKMPP